MERELLLDVAVLVDQDLYFTAVNSPCLYKRNKNTEEVRAVAVLPVESERRKKFSSMFSYENRLWMIPWDEKKIWIYDIEKECLSHLELPNEIVKNAKVAMFRRVMMVGQYIWAVPNETNCILRIDMKNAVYEIHTDFPAGVTFDSVKLNFKSISYDGKGWIYLFREGCSDNLVIDEANGQMHVLDLDSKDEFCNVYGDYIIVAPVKNGEPVRIYKLNSEKTKTELVKTIKLPDELWTDEQEYAYWYTDLVNGKWYIMPFSAKKILVVDGETYEISMIDGLQEGYVDAKFGCLFVGYQTIAVEKEVWIFSYQGNQILVLDQDNRVVNRICLLVKRENEITEILGLISEMEGKHNGKWSDELREEVTSAGDKMVGRQIYDVLSRRESLV